MLQFAGRGDFKYRPDAVRAAARRRAVEIAVPCLDKAAVRFFAPSVLPLIPPLNVYSTFSTPAGVTRNTVPTLSLPPICVVP
jgi:hypothetical protein